jgi:hypothetical protein
LKIYCDVKQQHIHALHHANTLHFAKSALIIEVLENIC